MRILVVVHGLPPRAWGGTELYVDALSRALAQNDEAGDRVLVLARDADASALEYRVRRERRGRVEVVWVNNTFRACRSFEDSYENRPMAAAAARVADEFRPDVAHVHHLTCLSTQILEALAARRIPIVYTLHDYWLICHRGQLLDIDYRLCDGPYDGGCARCLGAAGGVGFAGYAAARVARRVAGPFPRAVRWARRAAARLARVLPDERQRAESVKRLAHMQAAARLVTLFLAPSEEARRTFIRFGLDPDRVVRHEQGLDTRRFAARRVNRSNGPLRVGFLGSLIVSKGPQVLLEAVASMPRGLVSLRMYGAPAPYHDDVPPGLGAPGLVDPASPRLPFIDHFGAIPYEDVPAALRDIDVLAVPSIWSENAPFVVREAFAAGIPVVASRIGGLPEAVVDDVNGLLVEPQDPAALARALTRLATEPELLERLRTGIPSVRTIEDDVVATRRIYERAIALAGPDGRRLHPPHGTASARARLAAVVLNYHTPDETLLAVTSLGASRRPIDQIIVVDNGSRDEAAALRAVLPACTVVALGANEGFSGGINAGIRAALGARADLVMLVNSDVIVPPDTIGKLEAALDGRPGAGIAAPAIISRSEPDLAASLGMSYSPATGRMRHVGFGRRLDSFGRPRVAEVDGVSGCAMLVRRETFERAGLFDEAYFFSFEDLEFCLRARAHGLATVCVTDAAAYHEGGRSIGRRSARRVYFSTRNHLKLAGSAPGAARGWRAPVRTASVLAFNLAYVALSRDVPLVAGVVALAAGARDHFRGRYGPA